VTLAELTVQVAADLRGACILGMAFNAAILWLAVLAYEKLPWSKWLERAIHAAGIFAFVLSIAFGLCWAVLFVADIGGAM
jgi:hypothetical protein